jgi:hypothetical protein
LELKRIGRLSIKSFYEATVQRIGDANLYSFAPDSIELERDRSTQARSSGSG